ncbi:MAG TPA: Gfo/Idh/MocA family oxidoreductase [Steroidobacteraceae bacterium]|jgi:predicted dehydrogenase|nr:Gfo/Idh/MocA family oxidoreductase [Steroidobacteraceae bacterium]
MVVEWRADEVQSEWRQREGASIASKVKWGILSTANIGVKRVIPAIIAGQRGVVFGIASRDAGRATSVAARFGIARSYGNYQALLDDPEIEAVYNPLPNHLHVEWTVKALDAGKHVLCEKPIGLNAAEAQAIVAARDRNGRRVIEAFMVRCHPQWHRVRALVRAGRIGTVRTIHSSFLFTVLDPSNVRNRPEIGGGALYDVGCYPIVTARYVLGAEPIRAIALIDRDPNLGVDRVTSGMLEFPGGAQLVFSSALQLAPYQRVVILGSEGRIEVPVPFTPQKDHACRLIIDSGGSLDGGSAGFEDFAPVDQYGVQCDLAAAAFRNEAAQEFPIEDAIANMRVIDALYRSAVSGRWETP